MVSLTISPADGVIFAAVCCVTAAISLLVALATRNITFYDSGTDNSKQVAVAARVGEWRWPSDMHRYCEQVLDLGVRTRMKDAFVLCIVFFQRLLRDRTSDYPLVVLGLTANLISGVLVFLITSSYWNIGVGLLAWGLLLTCLSAYQLALFGTHIGTAQMFFLASVLAMQQAQSGAVSADLLWFFAAGVAIALMLFSSAASRKFMPLVAGAFVYSQRGALWQPDWTFNWDSFLTSNMGLAVISIAGSMVLAVTIMALTYRRIIAAVHSQSLPGPLNRLMSTGRDFNLEHATQLAAKLAGLAVVLGAGIALYLVLTFTIVHSSSFYWSQLALIVGAGSVVLVFTYPNVLENLWAYYGHSLGWKYNRFSLYRDYFAGIGHPIKDNMRGGGILWLVRFFSRVAPFHSLLYLAGLILVAVLLIFEGDGPSEVWGAAAVVALSLSPVLVGELTHAAQSSRSYFPGFVGFVLLVGYAAFQLDASLSDQGRWAFWSVMAAGVLASATWTTWKLFDDVLPARMAPARLRETLKVLGATEFYTYDTRFNDGFVHAVPPEDLARYQIRLIDSLKDVSEGYVVIPGTSSKAFNMESIGWAIEHGDYDLDPELNRLIESKEIEKYAVASFKTFGTSRFWPQEAEITTYRDLILREINDEDRWRGRAWILDAAKLRSDRQGP